MDTKKGPPKEAEELREWLGAQGKNLSKITDGGAAKAKLEATLDGMKMYLCLLTNSLLDDASVPDKLLTKSQREAQGNPETMNSQIADEQRGFEEALAKLLNT